jgi:hypothetical protein
MKKKFEKKINLMNRNGPLFNPGLHGTGPAQHPLPLGRPKPGAQRGHTPQAVTMPSVSRAVQPVGARHPVMEEVVGGESRRGLKGTRRARQAVLWLIEKL